ncbi:uncharacterized protein L969DRAFT_24912 [Mixia osmundae IAM 14324]|uniref:GrpE protein homolog, mitochondrial n=1 Tax=Mixia osmundae (strain CBS 9802 / IAM 14324 / JCM 22182 / KY 12970) TaxID=764103 RepID=G7E7M6_MIXOS|nr:uncharacterized protein L969DRAFT_24912 [Mixia osmundae IAM 14324]KEI38436.1 hypothetical protein L969DRAFT_24912 [Mixia osmundae IAM 14324]GAA98836.1 hypothetical protein E5Q_05524 [Mixia osmundae IAM 14324]
MKRVTRIAQLAARSTQRPLIRPSLAYQQHAQTRPTWQQDLLTSRRCQSTSTASEQQDPSVSAKPDDAKAQRASDAAQASPEALASVEKDKEIARLKDSLLRSLADYENLQKITTREKAAARDFAVQKLATDLVANTYDILSLALKSVPEAKRTDKANSAELVDLYTGVSLTQTELEKALRRVGVEQFDPTGEKFDPNFHEAMYQAPVPGKQPGTVLECQRKGWTIKGRLLRPAQVGVVLDSEQ